MVRTLKIRRVGGSLGAIFPKEMLEALHAGEGDELIVTRRGDEIVLTPPDQGQSSVLEAFERGRAKYRNTLRRLAE